MQLSPPIDPALERDAAELYAALRDLIRIYQFRDRDRICCHDLSVTQCYALAAVVEGGPMGLNDLAAHLYLDKSTASRVADALQRKELIRREPDPEDGRAVRLSTTSRGARLAGEIARQIRESEMRLLADFEPDVRRSMAALVRRLADAAAERVETTGGTCCSLD